MPAHPADTPPPLPTATHPPERREPALTNAPPAGRKFPCPKCGARLDFDPSVRGLKCPYCGYTEVIPEGDGEQIQERDFEEYLGRQAEKVTGTIEGRSSQVRCPGCGAVVLLEDKVVTERCPFCGTHLENKPEAAEAMIQPESLLPFHVTQREARDAFLRWVVGLWFAPTELKVLAILGQLSGVYVPFWTYDAMTYTSYTGMRGDDYWETETYTERDAQGNTVTKTRQVRKTSWRYVSGEVQNFFDDVLVCGSRSLPDYLVSRLDPWELPKLEPFRPEFLSGFKTERYAVDLADGFARAREVMEGVIDGLCRQDIGGDHQRITSKHTNYVGVTFKHLLLPVWVAVYRYRDKTFRVLVNAQTGKVAGDRPWSWFKIVRLIVLIALAVLLIGYLIYRFSHPDAGPAGFGMRGEETHKIMVNRIMKTFEFARNSSSLSYDSVPHDSV